MCATASAEIHAPTLVISGEFDEATPLIAETVHKGIPGSEWVLFENCSHITHAEEPERYMQVLGDFISRSRAVEEEKTYECHLSLTERTARFCL